MVYSDWWMFGATIGAGILAAVATWCAVVYTNSKTAAQYKDDKLLREKEKARVILKPTVKFGTFGSIMDELIAYNIHDRLLVLSTNKDGFDFYDDDDAFYSFNHSIFSIGNESKNTIKGIKITTTTKLITASSAVIEDTMVNGVALLRGREEIVFRMNNTEQRDKLWAELNMGKTVQLNFSCGIEYQTLAKEQMKYVYEAIIDHSPFKHLQDGKEITCVKRNISVIKDEYEILGVCESSVEHAASVFRNLQDRMPIDRVSYAQRRVGAAQASGMLSEFQKAGGFNNNTMTAAAESTDEKSEVEV